MHTALFFSADSIAPEWAVHKQNSPSEIVRPMIPFVGKHYAEQKAKILAYASAENLSGYNFTKPPQKYIYCGCLRQFFLCKLSAFSNFAQAHHASLFKLGARIMLEVMEE